MKDPIAFIQKRINSATYELCDTEGKLRGLFNIKHLKLYLSTRHDEKDLLVMVKFVYRLSLIRAYPNNIIWVKTLSRNLWT
jgi:hypothetical protein